MVFCGQLTRRPEHTPSQNANSSVKSTCVYFDLEPQQIALKKVESPSDTRGVGSKIKNACCARGGTACIEHDTKYMYGKTAYEYPCGPLRQYQVFLPTHSPFDLASTQHDLTSVLAGLSSKARSELAEKFGSLEGARVAGEAELRRVPGVGPVLAKRILA